MHDFELLKRTYPISQFDRICDGYEYILKHSTLEERKQWGVVDKELKKIIKSGEKYIYQVAKEKREFKTMCLSFENYKIIRNKIFELDDE